MSLKIKQGEKAKLGVLGVEMARVRMQDLEMAGGRITKVRMRNLEIFLRNFGGSAIFVTELDIANAIAHKLSTSRTPEMMMQTRLLLPKRIESGSRMKGRMQRS
jgi:hypothetical protein